MVSDASSSSDADGAGRVAAPAPSDNFELGLDAALCVVLLEVEQAACMVVLEKNMRNLKLEYTQGENYTGMDARRTLNSAAVCASNPSESHTEVDAR
jgi:hypothetical protein